MATKDVLLIRNPSTGQWDLQKGAGNNPVTDTTAVHAVLTQLLERRGSPGNPGWIWDSLAGSGTPDTHGSLLYLVDSDTPESRSQFKAYCLDALAPLVAEGRIANATADVAPSSTVRGRIDGLVTWTVPGDNQAQTLVVPFVFP